jgi:membrane associated rhomboid family serine protease
MDSIQSMAQSYNGVALGASGAVYGILVAFGIMFPNVELMLIFLPIPIKAKYFIPGIIVMDLIFGITGTATGIAHWAHIGGALFGFIMAWYWKKNSFDNHRWN